MSIANTIRKLELKADLSLSKFIWNHPFWGALMIFIGMPLLVLGCVCISTFAIAAPMSWFFGWM